MRTERTIHAIREVACTVVLMAAMAACSKEAGTGGGGSPTPPAPPTPPPAVTPLITLPTGWKLNTTYTSTFPSNVQLYTFDSTWGGRQTRAYCFAYESGNTTLELRPRLAATAQTPASFVQQEPGTVYACINGGFFGSDQSYSLVRYNGATASPNIKLLSRPLGHYYPTRGAFGILPDGKPSIGWVYHIGSGNDNLFRYPEPAANDEARDPLPAPDANFPAGGALWNIVSGIGGSPVLVYNNEVRVTDKEELISINNTTSRPRSAIGYTSGGVILLLAVQGDNFVSGYAGLNLQELASMLKSLGCTHALNLDGGGSTSMLVGGMQTVKPSATGVERPVVSVVMVKRK